MPDPIAEPRHLMQALPLWSIVADPPSVSIRTAQRLCDLTTIAVAGAFAIPVAELVASSRRSRSAAFARQSAVYLAHVAFGLSYHDVGRAFGHDRTTAAHACRLVEERRDDPAVDEVIGALERSCKMVRRRLGAPVQVAP